MIIYRIENFLIRLKMGFKMFFRGYNSYCWESSEIYLDIAKRLEICYDTFLKDKYYVWCGKETNRQMRNIREAIHLCKSLYNQEYYNKNILKVMTKYKSKTRGNFIIANNSKKRKSIEEKLYKHLTLSASKKDRIFYEERKQRLFKLLKTGLETWST